MFMASWMGSCYDFRRRACRERGVCLDLVDFFCLRTGKTWGYYNAECCEECGCLHGNAVLSLEITTFEI